MTCQRLSRTAQYDRKYKERAPEVRSSISRVARAGRTGDPSQIEAERERHKRLMASL